MESEQTVNDWQELMEQSQRVAADFVARYQQSDDFSIFDPAGIVQAFGNWTTQMLADPVKLGTAQGKLWQEYMTLWQETAVRMLGEEADEAHSPDRRFKDKAWQEEAIFDYMKRSYLLTGKWLQSVISDVDGLNEEDRNKVDFYSRQFISAMAPSNFAITNPSVLKRVKSTHGQCLLDGLKNMLRDLEKGGGELKITMTDESAFEVGKNLAVTPGKVIFQNDLMQLIQYAPSTKKVYQEPLIIVPPWINKFYILDLQEKNSFVKWVVDQGHTVFLVSWVNPTKDLAEKTFDDYMREGPLTALEVAAEATGMERVNLLGFCIGGILCEATLAYLRAKGDKRVASLSLLTTMLDFKEVGEVAVFLDDEQIHSIEEHVGQQGYLEGKHMAQMFSMMRENDLIWSFVVNNYLLGRDPMAFDLLYWNADSTRLPAEMLVYYLKKFYRENGLIKKKFLRLCGEKIDVTKIDIPVYSVATKDDHIAPWVSCYPVTQKFSGKVRFVLGGSGHIAGIVNPPAANKYCYWVNPKYPANPDKWLAGAQPHEGSWWPDWANWVAKRSAGKVAPRVPGDGSLKPIEDAPGSYVTA
jgi:polyhydroxyalkanoate synthase